MRGRKPKPEALHQLAGNPGKRKRPTPAATARPFDPYAPPAHLTTAEKKVWAREMQFFAAAGYGKPADLSAFAFYVQAVVRYEEARADVETYGKYVTTPTGFSREHPAVKAVREESKAIKTWLEQLGLTTRSRLTAAQLVASRQLELPNMQAQGKRGEDATDPAHSMDDDPDDPIGYGARH